MRKIKKRGMIRLQQNLKSADKVNGENTAETIEENAGAKSGYVEETEKIVEDTVTVTPDEVIFDETEKEAPADEKIDVENAVEEAETDDAEVTDEKVVEDTVTITPDEVTFDETEKEVSKDEKIDVEYSVGEALKTDAEENLEGGVAETAGEEEMSEEADKAEAEEISEESENTEDAEDVAEEIEEVTDETEEAEEVPLEAADEEIDEILNEEGSLDGSEEEVEALKSETEAGAEEEIVEDTVTVNPDEVTFEEAEKEVPADEKIDVEKAVEEAETDGAEVTDEKVVEDTITVAPDEVTFEETEKEVPADEKIDVEESVEEAVEETADKEDEEEKQEQKPAEKEGFKLTAPENLEEVLARICVKRGRKLIYRPNEILFNCTAAVIGTDKNNEEGIKVKNILDEEIKQGVKLGYIDKFDGLKMSEIKEEYENDTVYEYAEQEFKRTGLVLDGDKIKVYIYDWDMKALHHVGYVDPANVEELKPYLENRDNYSFDICGLITGGKYRKVIKDESGKVTVEKGNDGKIGLELDISILNRKD